MKKIALFLLFAWQLVAADVSVDRLFEMAEKEDKLIVVFVEKDNCPWCKRMLDVTFTNPKVEAKLKEFVVGYFNIDHDKMPDHLKARITPTVKIVNKDGMVVSTISGYQPAGPFIKLLEEAQSK